MELHIQEMKSGDVIDALQQSTIEMGIAISDKASEGLNTGSFRDRKSVV